jgi:CubicO group peptidase (beta-lactamase class C family)
MKKSVLASVALLIALSGGSQSLEDSLELRAFMDGVMLTHLRDKHIAGATISIIKDGKILLASGYGFSDVKARHPVSADASLFRIGSISKMFVWISVMELVSQGKLKLDEDINHYLKDFKIPEAFAQPITLKHLMTHTPGFEDHVIGLFMRDSSSLNPLGEILSHELPARVRPPGVFASYSNHGAGIAAYIVEQTTGRNFNDYVENNILIPLQMNVTTFRQPLPRFLKPMLSKGYTYTNNELIEKPFEIVPLYPIGGASSSASDMAKFMSAILNNGHYNETSILDSTTLHFMESPAHRHHPSVNPMPYGFIDMSRNGVTVIGHGGDTYWFHSLMALFPESRAGLFVSFNTDTGGPATEGVLDEFMNRYFPERNHLAKAIKVNAKFLQRFAGAYRPNRYDYHDVTTVASLFGDVRIEAVNASTLKVTAWETVKYYVPVDSVTFREEHTSEIIAFKENQNGEIIQLFMGSALVLDKVNMVQSADTHRWIFLVVVLITLLMLFYWPLTSRARRGYELMDSPIPLPSGAKFIAWLNYFLLAAFYAGVVMSVGDPFSIVYGVPTALKIVLILPFLIIPLTLIMYLQLYRIWNQRRYSAWSRMFYVLITLVSTAALWQLYYWNYIGFNY